MEGTMWEQAAYETVFAEQKRAPKTVSYAACSHCVLKKPSVIGEKALIVVYMEKIQGAIKSKENICYLP